MAEMKYLIFNADDFGYSRGINRGIIKAHTEGVVTGTSLMVNSRASDEVKILLNYPKLSVGLHFDISDEAIRAQVRGAGYGVVDLPIPGSKIKKIKADFLSQIEKFKKLVGRLPNHLNGHYHIHLNKMIRPIFEDFSKKRKIPVRAYGKVNFIDSFFGWDESRKTDLKRISVEALLKILGNLKEGVSEIMCHPGFVDEDLRSASRYQDEYYLEEYLEEREEELKTLTDERIKEYIKKSGIMLCGWKDISNLY